jgi:arylformamidase
LRREATSDQWEDSGVTVSSIHSTVHIGAHADAPNHIELGRPGIDEVDISRYVGVCQVIELEKPAASVVLPADLADVDIRAPRILLKTGSFPDVERFNEDFVACSGELVGWLAARGVFLIGIDTPSIDPCHSKTLPAHHAAVAADMAILEGIVLAGVGPGIYELIAVPLRLEGADASPVRAILRPSAASERHHRGTASRG